MSQFPEPAAAPAAKRDRWANFRGLPAWQTTLAVIPLVLIALGGLLGGLIGAVGMVTNLKLARSGMGTVPKAIAMVGVVLAAVIVYIVVAVALLGALK